MKDKIFNLRIDIGKISKDSTNAFFHSKYFDINALIEHLQPLLEKHKLILTQPIRDNVVFSIIEDVESEESISSGLPLPPLTDPQKIGSCVTYYRRYTLASLLAIQAEDDDANKASQPEEPENDKPWLNPDTPQFQNALKAISEGKTIKDIRGFYKVSKKVEKLLTEN